MVSFTLASLTVLLAAEPGAPKYELSPVVDAAVLVLTAGFSGTLEVVLKSGELQPQPPGDPSELWGLDRRVALSEKPAASALGSNLFLGLAIGGALADVALSPILDRPDGLLTHATLYAESAMVNIAVSDLAKVAVRRPRPRAYQAVRKTGLPPADIDSSLSFYSLHTALTAGLCATATHLAFTRSPASLEPWLILGGGTLLTALVGWQRVESRAHFPTDVLAGALVGAAIGTLVPELHRLKELGVSVLASGSSIALAGSF